MRTLLTLFLFSLLCTGVRAQLAITADLGLVADYCSGTTPDPNVDCISVPTGNDNLTYLPGQDGDLFFTYRLINNSGKIIRRVLASDSRFGTFFPTQAVNIPNGATVPLNIIYDALTSPETTKGEVKLTVKYADGSTERVTGTYALTVIAPQIFRDRLGPFNKLKKTKSSDSSQLSVFPNPAADQISLRGFTGGTVSVVDLQGRTLLRTTLPEFGSLNISDLSAGIYLLRAGRESIRWVKR